jgi:hypothetical protein
MSTTLLLLSACFMADPKLPTIGVRQDQGVLAILVPLCPSERLESIYVYNSNGDSRELSWSASDPIPAVAQGGIVHLGESSEFRTRSGEMKISPEMEIVVRTSSIEVGFGFSMDEIPTTLSKDSYWTGGDPPTASAEGLRRTVDCSA